MSRPLARPVALGVIRDGDEIFVFEGRDHEKRETFYRPLGGTIEFGERAVDAVRRELAEEIDATVTGADLLGVLENTFTYQGQPGHEIDFVFEVTVSDLSRLRDGTVAAYEADGSAITCVWKPLADFRERARLYPDGLLSLLTPNGT
jgi:ADP-ribose pyrophosphatase YjhB (NUDIX family)